MKKSLIAMALFGAFAGPTMAQSMVVYGIADAGIEYNKGISGAQNNWRLQSGQQSTSRLGFRGTETLGGGLKASFTLESGINIDDGTLAAPDSLFSRQAWVSLGGNFGEVRLGRQQTPLYDAQWAIDPFHVNLAGGMQRVFGAGLYGLDPVYRADNTILYTAQDFGAFGGQLMYSFGEQAGNFSALRQFSVGLSYETSPIVAKLVYHNGHDVALGTLGTGTATFRTVFLGGTYDFGIAKLHLAFGGSTLKTAPDLDMRSWLIGATAPLGPAGTVLASYIRNDVRDIPEGVTNQYAIGYTHDLSKRTNLYTSLGYTTNDNGVRVRAFSAGENGRVFNVGVRHRF
jgi:predicted porin